LADVPAIGELVRLRGKSIYGVAAPKNTPAEIIDKLNKEINAVPSIRGEGAAWPIWVSHRLADRPPIRKNHYWRNREVGQGSQVLWAKVD